MLALVGWARLSKIVHRTPDELWKDHAQTAGITDHEFNRYFEGSQLGVGLVLDDATPAASPMLLGELRILGLQPPQSWRYLDRDLADRIMRLLLQKP